MDDTRCILELGGRFSVARTMFHVNLCQLLSQYIVIVLI